MPSGKHKSKENTWTEKDLTEALQGEKPRRSKDEARHRESRDDGSQKRHSKERGHEEREKDRQRSKHERSGRRRDESPLDYGEGSSRRTSGSKDDRDRERKHRDKTRDRVKDDYDEDGSNERIKEKKRRERHRDDDREERRKDRTRDEPSRRDKDGNDRTKERSTKSRDDRDPDGERSRDRHDREKEARDRDRTERRRDKEKDERKRDQEDDEGRRGREKDKRKLGKEKDERKLDRDSDDRKGEKDMDERKRGYERGERRRDDESDERRRGKEKRRYEAREDDRSSDRRKDKERDRRNHRDEVEEDDDYEHDRERRRRKKEEKEKREKGSSRNETDSGSRDKDERRKERKDKERSEEDKEDRRRRREDREKRKQQEHDEEMREMENKRRHKERKENEDEADSRKRSKERSVVDSRTSLTQNEDEVHEEIENEDNYGEDNYEDDFEDYEDDFEDAEDADEEDYDNVDSEKDKGKLLEIFEAINAENSDVGSSPIPRTSPEGLREEVTQEVKTINRVPNKSSGERRINFFAAKQKHVNEFVASKTKKRAQELQNLIELDVASYDIFDLPPLNEYELYIKSYGQSDSKQAYVQCHDDIIEKEMQTEEIEMSTKWTQFPPDDFKGCGEGDESVDKDGLTESSFSPQIIDSAKLLNFLQQAGQVCLILLEEMTSGKTDLMFKERNDINISDGFIQLATKLPFLEGRLVLDMNFNSIQTHLLLTAHSCNGSPSSDDNNDLLRGKGVVCFWNVNEPSQPRKILFCESSPRSCCFSPIKSSLVFAGLEDGSVVIWDIRESSSLHSTIKYKENQWIVRRPTFSTAGVFNNENHLSPVQSILPISLPKESAEASIRPSFVQDDPGGMAFQLASLEENGVVNIWVVIELDKPDEAGSENDLGLAPGGRVKLIKSTTIQVESPNRDVFTGSSVQTSMMQFSNEDSNHFYAATDRGWVVHCTRYGGRTHPKSYRPDIDTFVTVTTMDVSPWSIPIMLVGCADGTLRLHDLRKEHAIRSWPESTQGNPIAQVKWSKSRPSLFYVLDTKSNFYIWDLLQKDGCPVATEHFKRGKLLFFSISNDYESLGIGLPGRKSELVLNYEGGTIELHRLKEIFTNVEADELDRVASLVESFI